MYVFMLCMHGCQRTALSVFPGRCPHLSFETASLTSLKLTSRRSCLAGVLSAGFTRVCLRQGLTEPVAHDPG